MDYFENHPNLDMVELYLLDRLHHQDKQIVAEHLASCHACQVMTEKLQEQIDIIYETMAA